MDLVPHEKSGRHHELDFTKNVNTEYMTAGNTAGVDKVPVHKRIKAKKIMQVMIIILVIDYQTPRIYSICLNLSSNQKEVLKLMLQHTFLELNVFNDLSSLMNTVVYRIR